MQLRTFSIQELAQVVDGKILTWDTHKVISSFAFRLDQITTQCLFIVLSRRINEDQLLDALVSKNISGIVIGNVHLLDIEKWAAYGIGIIQVASSKKAVYHLAKLYRSGFHIPFIQVIGSSGKTTTKEMIHWVLKEKLQVLATPKNANAPLGVANVLFRTLEHFDTAVLEVGMKQRGVMNLSSSMIKPTIAVVTCIHRAHLARLGSIQNIIAAKAESLHHISPRGTLIINGEDENCLRFLSYGYKGEILRFGFSDACDLWASHIRCEQGITYFTAHAKNFQMDCCIHTFGKYNIGNALAAILVGLKLGMSPDDIIKGLAKFQPLAGRLQILQGIHDTTIVHDHFNANPDSTKSLLSGLPQYVNGRSLILVMGDMESPRPSHEDYSKEVHYKIGQQIADLKFEHLIAVGKWASEYVNGAAHKGIPIEKLHYYRTIKKASASLLTYIPSGSIVVFKGSSYANISRMLPLLLPTDETQE